MRPPLVALGTEPGARVRVNTLAGIPDGLFPCACWCDQGYVLVTREDLHAGRTYTCGREGCHEHGSAAA